MFFLFFRLYFLMDTPEKATPFSGRRLQKCETSESRTPFGVAPGPDPKEVYTLQGASTPQRCRFRRHANPLESMALPLSSLWPHSRSASRETPWLQRLQHMIAFRFIWLLRGNRSQGPPPLRGPALWVVPSLFAGFTWFSLPLVWPHGHSVV